MARDNADTETWETTTASQVAIMTYDARGAVRAQVVGGRPNMRVRCTHAEREELNEDVAATADLCIFRNGTLRPLLNVPDDVMERFRAETLRHGGHSAAELIAALETVTGSEFEEWVAQLNEPTLRRLAELADAADAKASQVNAITASLGRFAITGPEGTAARMTEADKIVHAEPKTPGSSL